VFEFRASGFARNDGSGTLEKLQDFDIYEEDGFDFAAFSYDP